MKGDNPYRTIYVTLAWLILLLGAAVGLHYLPGLPAKPVLTILMVGAKTYLVIWYFMRARDVKGITPFYIVSGFVWLGILFLLTSADYLTR